MPTHKVFVYGTLKSQFYNCRVLRAGDAKLICDAVTVDQFVLLHERIPFMCATDTVKNGNQRAALVFGEIWECDDVTLRNLDRLEGHPHFYLRTPIMVRPLSDGSEVAMTEPVEAGAYIFRRPSSHWQTVKAGPQGWATWLAEDSLVA